MNILVQLEIGNFKNIKHFEKKLEEIFCFKFFFSSFWWFIGSKVFWNKYGCFYTGLRHTWPDRNPKAPARDNWDLIWMEFLDFHSCFPLRNLTSDGNEHRLTRGWSQLFLFFKIETHEMNESKIDTYKRTKFYQT